jgi:hypothetical protein
MRRLRAVTSASTLEEMNEPFDPWKTDDGSQYSRIKRYTWAGGNDAENMGQLKLGGREVRFIQALVQQRRIPEYDTWQAFVRDAVYHRIRDIRFILETDLPPDMQAEVDMMIARAAVEHDASRVKKRAAGHRQPA